jgi:hypothetical protein
MTGRTGFCLLVHEGTNLLRIRGITDSSILVIDSYLANPGLCPNCTDDVIDLIAMILEHGVSSTSFNGVADTIGTGEYRLLKMLPV